MVGVSGSCSRVRRWGHAQGRSAGSGGNGGCPPRRGDCVVGIVEFCVQLHGGGVKGGAGG